MKVIMILMIVIVVLSFLPILFYNKEKNDYIICYIKKRERLTLKGGCYTDCTPIGQNCWTIPKCGDSDECPNPGEYFCDDSTQEYSCKPPGVSPNCSYTAAHACSEKRMMQTTCARGYCMRYLGNYGNCGKTLKQCKD